MIDYQEFRAYAKGHLGMNSMHLDDYFNRTHSKLEATISPTVVEERSMNMVQLDVFSRLMMDRIIFLGVPVSDYVANVIQAQLLFLHSTDAKRDIQMYINSPGGSVTAGLGIYDTMQYVGPDVATICTSMSASMAAVLLAAGTKGKRSGLAHSRVMIHQPSGGMQGQVSDMEIAYRMIKGLQKELYQILSKHTGKPYDTILEDSDRDHWMSANEAQLYGILDEVVGG
ncbi:MAG: ATP-dependent Clp protease proteolytic subunit [Bacteroidota bacterium]